VEVVGTGDFCRGCSRIRPTGDHRCADCPATREHIAEGALLHHHGRCEDEIGPHQVFVLQGLDVHVQQAQQTADEDSCG
jgi:hypothetical protein